MVELLERQAAERLPELLGVLYGRMSESPFAFFRGTASVMALDMAHAPVTGLRVQACGDAHVGNFGEFATPERSVVFDINDFDETLPAPFEWDVRRLAASLELAFRGNGVDARHRSAAVASAVRTYRERIAEYASLRTLDIWYSRIRIDEVVSFFPARYRGLVRRDVQRGLARTSLRALRKLTHVVDGTRVFVEDPPLLVRLGQTGHEFDEVLGFIDGYRASLSEDRRALFDRFRLVDVARKAVGVGSVGTRCWVGLFEGPHHPAGDPLVLQVKEAGPSVLEPYAGPSELPHHGLRVVVGQRLTQAASDIFLGWSVGPRTGRHYYARQLWDVKASGDPTLMEPANLARYGALCAWALARAHARTGDPVAITAYLGTSDRFDRATSQFASLYADQAECDHAALCAAITNGQLPSDRALAHQ
ncbi:MAG TPA: DUF2252 domain-containing protein [Solirubrobacteraceae bacterium]|nr:DUF2252 domain-containing protein [Solirubrobacteraceae bacterium]